jgi:hypothetical protein
MARKRRSFPIPLKSRYAEAAVAEQVIIDLVHKFPRGPLGTQEKHHYNDYYTDPGLAEAENHLEKAACGYDPIAIYRMAVAHPFIGDDPTSEYDYRGLVREMWPDLGDRGVTRRSRRLAKRIGSVFSQVVRRGMVGIWNVNWGYGRNNSVYVHANDERDANQMAQMFFGPIMGDDSHRCSARFVREGSPLELLNANDDLLKGFDEQKERALERIEKLKAEIETFETNKSFVQMYSINCMDATPGE